MSTTNQPSLWDRERQLPVSGRTAISRHNSAKAAHSAARTRGTKTLQYLDLLARFPGGLSDHDAARMLGCPLSSINSIRNGCGSAIEANPHETGTSPYGKDVTLWRRVTNKAANVWAPKE